MIRKTQTWLLGGSALALLGLGLNAYAFSGSGPEAGSGLASAPRALDDEEDEADDEEGWEMDLRDLASSSELSLGKVIAMALAAQPGQAVEAGLEGEVDEDEIDIFFEVMIVGADKSLHEVKLSPVDGHVLENSIENGAEELAELRMFREALRHSERSLTQLIDSASGLVHGRALAAALEYEDGGPECEVQLVQGRYLVAVEVEARAGHVVGVELEGGYDEHADEDGEHGQQKGHADEDGDEEDED